MKFKQWQYSPGLWPTVLTILVLPLFVCLGFWQLDRAEQKQIQYDRFVQGLNQAAVEIKQLDKEAAEEPGLWKKVIVSGQFHEAVKILLDNQSLNARVGYFVFYPFKLEESEQWLLVNLGWVAAGNDRRLTPKLNEIQGTIDLEGVLKKAPFSGITLKETGIETLEENILRVQKIDYDLISSQLGITLHKQVLRLNENSAIGYEKKWSIPGSGKETNIGYAMQWFAFAFILLFIHFYLNIKRIDDGK